MRRPQAFVVFILLGLGMKKIFIRVLCCLIPSRRLRHKFRYWLRASNYVNNKIIIIAKDGTRREVSSVPGCVIKFNGSNNCLELYEPIKSLELDIQVVNDFHLIIEPALNLLKLNIRQPDCFSMPMRGNLVHIGRGCSTSNWMHIHLMSDGGNVIIGNDCLFSWGCEIRTGDHHTILKQGTREVLNHSQDVVIGNHVWFGSDVCMTKGAMIPDNSVVGMRSLVTKKFTEPNVVIAGSPARVVRTGIDWDRKSINEYENAK